MSSSSTEFNIYNNLLKYIDIIKFKPDDKKINNKKDFIKTLQFHSYIKIKAKDEKNNVLYAFLLEDDRFVSKSIEFKRLLNTVQEKKVDILIISKGGIKTTVMKFINSYSRKNIRIKDLRYAHFKMDPRKNILVPKHHLCTEEETRKIMEDNNIEDINMFPKIKKTDVQVLWLGGSAGQLVKIKRNTVIGFESYYRVIV
jgi:DNA-directed RNA polymerase subunit H (RpoH/RPB5)